MIKLKPQWRLRQSEDGRWSLVSEGSALVSVTPEQASILQKAKAGISPEAFVNEITDVEFAHLGSFINRGFIDQNESGKDAPFWELGGAYYHAVKEQQKHLTVSVSDFTRNKLGADVLDLLVKSGIKTEGGRQSISLVFVDTMEDIPDGTKGVVLPIVCNRAKVTVGPFMFPWSYRDQKKPTPSESYAGLAEYELPVAAHALQVAWIANNVLQYVSANRLRFIRHVSELNLAKLEMSLWPV